MKGHELMKTNPKLVFAVMVGVSFGVIGGIAIRGQQVKTHPAT
jgi:hypothetical protein